MTPIILEFNQFAYDITMRNIEKIKAQIRPYFERVAEINGMAWTPELFRDFVIGNGNMVEGAIATSAVAPLISSANTSQTLIDAKAGGDKTRYWQLYKLLQKDKARLNNSEMAYLAKGYITIDYRGRLITAPTATDQVRELFTKQIKTERGKALYEAQKAIAEALNEITTLAGISNGFYLLESINCQSGKFEFELLDYDKIAAGR